MSTPHKSSFIKSARLFMTKHSPEILTGIGIAGMITTTVLAVKATPKALRLLEEKQDNQLEKLTPIDVVKTTWKCYIPAAVTGVASITCLVGASSVSVKRNAALATAYQLSTTALNEYKAKVVETIGEKKEQAIREKIDKDHVDNNPVSQNTVIVTKKGSTLCMDGFSKRYFESDIEDLHKSINRLNAMLVREGEVCLNDLYDELGLDHSEVGYNVGWNINRLGRELVDLGTSAQIADDGRPCIVINCNPAPEWNYSRY